MSKKCRICDSGRATEIDALLASELSLTKIAAKTGFGRVTVWRHSKHARESDANAPGSSTAADRALLRQWQQLHRKSVKDGALDTAARCLQSIAEVQARLAAPPPKASRPSEVRFKVIYENGAPFGGTEEPTAAHNAASAGVGQALGTASLPTVARRHALITELANFFGVDRECAETLILELEKAKPQDWEEMNGNQSQPLLEEKGIQDTSQRENGQARRDGTL